MQLLLAIVGRRGLMQRWGYFEGVVDDVSSQCGGEVEGDVLRTDETLGDDLARHRRPISLQVDQDHLRADDFRRRHQMDRHVLGWGGDDGWSGDNE